jgi:hypothetical protein
LLEQVPPLLGRQGLDQLLFGRRQNPLEADHEQVADQVGVDVLGPPAHVVLLEARDPFADGRFDLSQRFHGVLDSPEVWRRCYQIPGANGIALAFFFTGCTMRFSGA